MRHKGRRTKPVRPSVTGTFVVTMPAVESKLTRVSPKNIEYARIAQHVIAVTTVAGNQLVEGEIVALHASRYDRVLV